MHGSGNIARCASVTYSSVSDDRLSQNQRQRDVFNNPAVVQEFMRPLPVEIQQVGAEGALVGHM